MTTAYLAAEGHAERLSTELARAGQSIEITHDRLFVSPDEPIDAAWAANIWYDVERLDIASIGDAARQLRDRQRSWAAYAPDHRGRMSLIEDRLPPLSGRPLGLGELAPASPLGSWTLLDPDTMLAAGHCSSAFPNGEVRLAELKVGPPNRAYRKVWEAFVVLGRFPAPGDVAVDLGASPGGWSWLLAELGADVVAVDKAPLDPGIAANSRITPVQGSAFALQPTELQRPPQWVCSDVACYPKRLLPLVERWSSLSPVPTLIFTLKLQGDTDHDVVDQFTAVPGARVQHLHHNKHELTFFLPGPPAHSIP
jgi:23S rRNA (cytidine2498-2'-O)-methyltransferase